MFSLPSARVCSTTSARPSITRWKARTSSLGVELAKQATTRAPRSSTASAAHHNDVEPQTVEAVLIQAADAISAARPGARRESIENYIQPSGKAGGDFQQPSPAWKSRYAIQSGREVRIMVKPEDISDEGTYDARPAKLPSASRRSWNIRDRFKRQRHPRDPLRPSSRSNCNAKKPFRPIRRRGFF